MTRNRVYLKQALVLAVLCGEASRVHIHPDERTAAPFDRWWHFGSPWFRNGNLEVYSSRGPVQKEHAHSKVLTLTFFTD